jgi:hypothetical protein
MMLSTVSWLAAVAMAFVGTASAQAQAPGDRVENPAAGIVVVKPAGWQVGTLPQIEANRDRVRMADDRLQAAIQKAATAPLFVFTRYPEPIDKLNPTIQVVLRPLGQLADRKPVEILETVAAPLKQAFKDFRLVSAIEPTTVSGLPAARMKAAFSIANQEGRTFPTLSRMLIIPRGRLVFIIGMSGTPDGPDASEDEFTAFVKTIELQQ